MHVGKVLRTKLNGLGVALDFEIDCQAELLFLKWTYDVAVSEYHGSFALWQ